MPLEFELDSVDFVTVGTVGPPGNRIFHIQAKKGEQLLTLIAEKQQVAALAESILSVLDEIEREFELPVPEADHSTLDLELHEPILPVFRVAQMGLGYDNERDHLILVVNELLAEDASGEPRVARISATREQMHVLALHALEVVAQGRPVCGNCGQPVDSDGHFCPKSNGRGSRADWA